MDLTTDKLRSLVRKWQTLIEAHVDVKTTDGYFLRLFCIAFTKKRPGQVRPALSASRAPLVAAPGTAWCAAVGRWRGGLARSGGAVQQSKNWPRERLPRYPGRPPAHHRPAAPRSPHLLLRPLPLPSLPAA